MTSALYRYDRLPGRDAGGLRMRGASLRHGLSGICGTVERSQSTDSRNAGLRSSLARRSCQQAIAAADQQASTISHDALEFYVVPDMEKEALLPILVSLKTELFCTDPFGRNQADTFTRRGRLAYTA